MRVVVARLFPPLVLALVGIFAAVALVVGMVGAILRGDGAGNVILSAIEAAILAFVGGLLARSFISLLLWTGRDSPRVGFVLGWAFFLWPGLIDSVGLIFKRQWVTRPVVLLWIAASVGSFTGMMDGLWQTHQWAGLGAVAFTLDETWGLNGSTQGDLLHLVNFSWGDHVVGETRTDAHRYQKGFAVEGGFAFTQGAVMSSNTAAARTPTWNHENIHVWQNRGFGPIFTLSYIAWAIIFFLPGVIYGLVSGDGAFAAGQAFSYFSNPWETWAYTAQGVARSTYAPGTGIWPDAAVVIVSIIFFPLFLLAGAWIGWRVWRRARSEPAI